MKLIATKPLPYAGRRLLVGDAFTARTPAHARVLVAIKKARPADAEQAEPQLPDIDALRGEYLAVLGKRPFNGWDAQTLAAKIAAERAKN